MPDRIGSPLLARSTLLMPLGSPLVVLVSPIPRFTALTSPGTILPQNRESSMNMIATATSTIPAISAHLIPLRTAGEFFDQYQNQRVELVRGVVKETPMPTSNMATFAWRWVLTSVNMSKNMIWVG
jgi:hypothetical protein